MKSVMDEHDDKCRNSSKTRRSVDAYPVFSPLYEPTGFEPVLVQ
jgi:hypothetical protein